MLSRERLCERFVELVKIYSPSKNEKEQCDYIVDYFKKRNIEAKTDKAGSFYGGNGYNILLHIKGEENTLPICFAAHLDQIEPCKNVNPIVDGNIIKSDGTTTLGADDKGAVAAILEVVEDLLESGAKHRDLYLLFTVSEEISMEGAKHIDEALLECKDILIADATGPAGTIAYKAPAMEAINIKFKGKKAHAGIEPEKGINAIVVASKAIANMHIGRIDEISTSNIGRIEGGGATNVVTDEVNITAEIRSHDMDILAREIAYMEKCCKVASEDMGASYEFEHKLAYPSFSLSTDSELFNIIKQGMIDVGIEPHPMVIGGGSDANILASRGCNSIIVSTGMMEVHTVNEWQDVEELWKTTKLMRKILEVS